MDLHTVNKLKAQECKTAGNEKFKKCDYEGASIQYKNGLLYDPENIDLHANLAATYLHLERYLDAEEHAVYTIHLKPNFFKGYLRAAKAAHGKGLTTLALKRLNKGLSLVKDQLGLKELLRLKTQYTGYMSLKSNAEREMDIGEEDGNRSEEDSETEDDDEDLADESNYSMIADTYNVAGEKQGDASKSTSEKSNSPTGVNEKTKKSSNQLNEPPKTEDAKVQGNVSKTCCSQQEKQEQKCKHSKGETKKGEAPETEEKTKDNDHPTDVKDLSDVKEGKRVQSDNKNSSHGKHPDKSAQAAKVSLVDQKKLKEFAADLKTGGEALLGGNYRKAAEFYKLAIEMAGPNPPSYGIDETELEVMKYAYAAANIKIGTYEDIFRGLGTLSLVFMPKFLGVNVLRAQAYCILNRFKHALVPIEEVLDTVGQPSSLTLETYKWPGTSEAIPESTLDGLLESCKDVKKFCRMPHKPLATCRYDNCLNTTSHIIPSELIYLSDPDFIGFVRMVCEEKCHIEFHVACWKAYKESVCGIGKINDKDLLGRHCLTMDCVNSEGSRSIITIIEIVGADGHLKSCNKFDPKTTVDLKKAKKKKCSSKLDDKEKGAQAVKPKKQIEKKVREVKKPFTMEEEEVVGEAAQASTDDKQELELRIQALNELRSITPSDDRWDPRFPFYGRSDETDKWVDKGDNESNHVQYIDYTNEESVDVRDAKEFIFSYFVEILKAEGPLETSEIERLWASVADDFCNIKVVLPNLTRMCDLLLESTCFCLIDSSICLASQLHVLYGTVNSETSILCKMIWLTLDTPSNAFDLQDMHRRLEGAGSKQVQVAFPSLSDETSDEELISDPPSYCDTDNIEESDAEGSEVEENVEEELDGEKFYNYQDTRYQQMLDLVSRVRSMFMNTNSGESLKTDATSHQSNKDTSHQSNQYSSYQSNQDTSHQSNQYSSYQSNQDTSHQSNQDSSHQSNQDTMGQEYNEIADGSSQHSSYNDKVLSQGSGDNNVVNSVVTEEVDKVLENVETDGGKAKDLAVASTTEEDVNIQSETENHRETDDCNKASQSIVQTEERHTQTTTVQTKDSLTQTKERDVYKELAAKTEEVKRINVLMKDLDKQIKVLTKENSDIGKKVTALDEYTKELQALHLKAKTQITEERKQASLKCQEKVDQIQQKLNKAEALFKKKEDKLVTEIVKLKENEEKLFTAYKDELKDLNGEKKSIVGLLNEQTKKIISCQQAQLVTTKALWDSQVNMLKQRGMEKMSEMHRWFCLLTSGEMDKLPSCEEVPTIVQQWKEICDKLPQLQIDFERKYNDLEAKLSEGEEIQDMSCFSLPSLPEEPKHLPLDNIHKEIFEKYKKRVSELTQLVADQQLDIEKLRKSSSQQMVKPFQMAPRAPAPLTTAFGSLAFQYPYPQNVPTPFGPTLPPNQDILKMGANKPRQADVQTLLKESTTTPLNMFPIENPTVAVPTSSNTTFAPSLFNLPPPCMMPPPPLSFPPPPVGVAHNLLKASTTLTDKEKKPVSQYTTSKPEKSESSRETTPVPAPSTSNPTPEKSKKKKKTKGETKEQVEVSVPSPDLGYDLVTVSEDSDSTPWSVITAPGSRKAKQTNHSAPVSSSDSKLRNMKKLLDKLQLNFPTTSLNELDESVRIVREENNGSLSGLAFVEINTRVERLLSKKHFQKTSTMGLDKFTAAWGAIKQQETVTWTNLQLEECTICLELLDNDRTKIDCNHEFHTKCLRKWLKEKSVCPLCNKFTTMPDEFPAL